MPLVIIPRDEVRDGEPFWAAMTLAKAQKIVAGGRQPRPWHPPRPGERKWGRFAVVDREATHGGPRPGAGRPRSDAPTATERIEVRATEAEKGELLAGLRDGETLSDVLREGGLRLVRSRP